MTFLRTPGTRTPSLLPWPLAHRHAPPEEIHYLGVTMEFHLFKNLDREPIINAFVNASKSESPQAFTEMSLTDLKNHYGTGVIR